MDLQHTNALIAGAGKKADADVRTMLKASYDELERAWFTEGHKDFSLREVTEAAFKGLDLSDPVIRLFHGAALEVARRVDAGDDKTAGNVYHNALHFAKVVVNFRALAEVQNGMVRAPRLSAEEIASGLFAAVSHDICHDGGTNIVNGQYQHFRLERRSMQQSFAWAQKAVQTDAERKALENALYVILATDITPNPIASLPSPARIVRQWHDKIFVNPMFVPAPIFGPTGDLERITSHEQRVLIAALLQDADVLSSLIEGQHEKESLRVMQEQTKDPSIQKIDPKRELYFLQTMLDGRMTTAAGGRLAGDFIKKMIEIYSKPAP